jgi:hypothetical protein
MFQRLSVCAAAILLSCGVANASPIKLKAGPTQQVLVASDADPGQEIDAVCNTYGNITGASLNITIPAGQSSLLVARFSGIVTVGGQSNSGSTRAYVRIVVGTHELNPVGIYTVSATQPAAPPPVEIERSGFVTSGAHVVKAQVCSFDDVSGGQTSAFVSNWQFTVEAAALPAP